MNKCLALVIGLGCCGSIHESGLAFRVVDAQSNQPLANVRVDRWASQWQPRILLPPGRFWFPVSSDPCQTDDYGIVRFDKYKSDDRYYFELEGYEKAFVAPGWFSWEVSNDSSKAYTNLSRQDGVLAVPLKKAKAQ